VSQSSISSPAQQGAIPKSRRWHCPVDFDAAKCLPPKLRRYEQEASYLLGLIHWQQAMRFGHLSKARRGGGVRLKAAYLRDVLGQWKYAEIIKAMEDSGAITCDHVAWPGRRSYTYNLGPLFSQRFRECLLTKPKIIKAMQKAEKERTTALVGVHAWLKGNLERIVLDQRAFRAADQTDHPDHAHTLLAAIDCRAWCYVRDKFGRCHTNITNLNRVLRKFLTVDRNYLISLDVSCSQPIILGLKMMGVNIATGRRPFVSSPPQTAASSSSLQNVPLPRCAACRASCVRHTIQNGPSRSRTYHIHAIGHPHTLND
jgi:hypothetical protein